MALPYARTTKSVKNKKYKYFICCIFKYNKEGSVISMLNNMRNIKLFLKQLRFLFVFHRFLQLYQRRALFL